MNKILGGLIGAVFGLLFGGGMLVGGYLMLGWQAEVEDYTPTSGRVVSSEVSEKSDDDGYQYSPHIVYTYTVDGKEYKNDSYYYMNVSTSSRGWAEEAVNNHPKGKEITVYHSRKDPQSSVLVKDTEQMGFVAWVPYLLMGVGGVILLIPLGIVGYVVLLVWVIHQGSKRSQKTGDVAPSPGSEQ